MNVNTNNYPRPMGDQEEADYDSALAGEPTELAPSVDETAARTAWALDDGPEWKPPFWTPAKVTAAALGVSVALIVAVAAWGGYTLASHSSDPPTADSPPPEAPAGKPPLATLDGHYRLDYLPLEQTLTGTAFPGEVDPATDTTYWAFRSACDEAGCVATGVGVDKDGKLRAEPARAVLRFKDGRWEQDPRIERIGQQGCLREDGTIGPGQDTERSAWTLTPGPGGTLRGSQVTTVVSDECGLAGNILDLPVIAARIGDAPVELPDPAAVPPLREAKQIPYPGVKLGGLYRIAIDQQSQTVNGKPATGAPENRTEVWAFRSACSDRDCRAVAVQVFDENTSQNTGITTVFKMADGQWRDLAPTVQPPQPCRSGPDSDVYTVEWSLVPQADGTLRGLTTAEIMTDGCGLKGYVYKTPMTAVRVGDTPPSVVFADPMYFMAP